MVEPKYETIRPRTRRLGRAVVHLAETDSTMDEARRLVQAGRADGLCVVADAQTRGRGRNQRTWHSPPGSLHATVAFAPPPAGELLGLLPTLAGVALAESIEGLVRRPAGLKWPNDVWMSGRKVAGLLVETAYEGDAPKTAYVGLGVNGDVRREEFPPDLRDTATSLSLEAGRHVCMPALLKIFLERFEAAIDALARRDTEPWRAEAERRSILRDRPVRVETPGGDREGTARGLGPHGELLVETGSERLAIRVGDCLALDPRPS